MAELLSCPFCRELFSEEEGPQCPDCEIPLVPLHKLPLSREGLEEAALDGIDPPEDQKLPWTYLGRGRGLLPLAAGVGIFTFFAPWVSLQRPDVVTLTGADLASSNAPWLWGGVVGYFLTIPLVLSRRTVRELQGIRVIATLFCAMTAGEVLMMLLRPPQEHAYFSAGLDHEWALYASLVVSAIASFLALRLGGSTGDLRDLPVDVPPPGGRYDESIH